MHRIKRTLRSHSENWRTTLSGNRRDRGWKILLKFIVFMLVTGYIATLKFERSKHFTASIHRLLISSDRKNVQSPIRGKWKIRGRWKNFLNLASRGQARVNVMKISFQHFWRRYFDTFLLIYVHAFFGQKFSAFFPTCGSAQSGGGQPIFPGPIPQQMCHSNVLLHFFRLSVEAWPCAFVFTEESINLADAKLFEHSNSHFRASGKKALF